MKQYQVIGGNLKLRRMPNQSSGVLKLIPNGATVEEISEGPDEWTRVEYDGAEGYCLTRYLRVLSDNCLDSDSLPAAIETAYANAVSALQELKALIDSAI